jgi:hypothetical protein
MSSIAAALAKSKGKVAPSFDVAETTPVAGATAAAPASPKKRLFLLAGLSLVGLLLGGGALWYFTKAPPATPKDAGSPAQTKPALPPKPIPKTAETPVPVTTKPAPTPPPVETPKPVEVKPPPMPVKITPPPVQPQLSVAASGELVQKWKLQAVRLGDEPRVQIAGRTFVIGEEISSGIFLYSLSEESRTILFRDVAGNTFRRYF